MFTRGDVKGRHIFSLNGNENREAENKKRPHASEPLNTHAASLGVLPVCPVLVLWSEADWPSGMPCCLVWCRLEMIVERSLSRL